MSSREASTWNPTPRQERAWTIAGCLLIAGAVVAVAVQIPDQPLPPALIGGVLFAVSLLIFAIGPGSATARRPLGTTALIIVGVFPLLAIATAPLIAAAPDAAQVMTIANIALGVRFAAALLAATAIGRNGAVPGPWRWVPLWSLVGITAAWLIGTLSVGAGAVDGQDFGVVLAGLRGTVEVVSVIFFGVLALVLPRTAHTAALPAVSANEQPVGAPNR